MHMGVHDMDMYNMSRCSIHMHGVPLTLHIAHVACMDM